MKKVELEVNQNLLKIISAETQNWVKLTSTYRERIQGPIEKLLPQLTIVQSTPSGKLIVFRGRNFSAATPKSFSLF